MLSQVSSTLNFLLVALFMFGGAGMLYRWLTGWPRLVSLYAYKRTAHSISKGSYRWVGCKINFTSLSVSLEIYSEGLWLKPGFPLSLFMPALLIPWSKIVVVESNTSFPFKKTVLQIAEFSGQLAIGGQAGLSVAKSVGQGAA